MIVSLKDGLKLVGISLVSACAVFVCTFFMNFYIDVRGIEYAVTDEIRPLYDAQLATARLVCAVAGGFIGVIVAVMLVFYVKLYVDDNSKKIGILKAMGYSDGEIALRFWVFGLSVLVGTVVGYGCGYAAMPTVYREMAIDGLPTAEIGFHAPLLAALTTAPTVVLTALACGYAYFCVKRPIPNLLRGITATTEAKRVDSGKDRSFALELCLKTLKSKKATVFFVAFSCFCFSAMVQMGFAMRDLDSAVMGAIILGIGLLLAAVSMLMAMAALINANKKNVSVMKAFGYSLKECALYIFGGYVPFALLGFGIGTGYQYGVLKLMTELVFKDVGQTPEYAFDVGIFFATLAAFALSYALVMLFYARRMNKISVKEIMSET